MLRYRSGAIIRFVVTERTDAYKEMTAVGDIHKLIEDCSARISGKVLETYHHLHMHPELSGEEVQTSRFIAEKLEDMGIHAECGIGGHGVIGIVEGGREGDTVAWRADTDAGALQEANDIPYKSQVNGVMHLCGHDAHTAIALGIAEVLMSVRNELCGSVKFIFQPCEEKSEGAVRMIQDGALDNPRPFAVYGLHQGGLGSNQEYMESGHIAINYGTVLYGFDIMDIRIDIARERINAWAEQELLISMLRRINGFMPGDKPSHNIINFEILNKENNDTEKYVKIRARFRYAKQEYRGMIRDKLAEQISEFSKKTGSAVTVEYTKSIPPVYNDEMLCDRAVKIFSDMGVDGIVRVLDEVPPHGADDYACFQNELSGLFFFLGSANLAKGLRSQNHTPSFLIDESCIPYAVRTMSGFLHEILERRK